MPSDSIQEPREENTNIEIEGIDNASTPQKMNNNQNRGEGAGADKLWQQEDLSVDDPAAAEAFEKYVTAESEYQAAQERLKKVFPFKDTDPAVSATHEAKEALAASDYQAVIEALQKVIVSFEHMDRDQIRSAVETYKEAKLRRNESLENLAIYSEEAAKMLEQVKETERRENEARAESERKSREQRTQLRNLQDWLEKLEKSQ